MPHVMRCRFMVIAMVLLLRDDFIHLKLDDARHANCPDLRERIDPGHSKGFPWYAIVDADGHALMTCDGPDGNIGYPVSDEEIVYFMKMIRTTARRMDEQDLAALEAIVRKIALGIREENARRERAMEGR